MARDNSGHHQPRGHLIEAKRTIRVPHDDYDGYVEAHVRRLEVLRRAGIVERINADNWVISEDFEQRAADYDANRSRTLTVRVLSAFDLEAQISSDGATWLDRQLVRTRPGSACRGRVRPGGHRRQAPAGAGSCRAGFGRARRRGPNSLPARPACRARTPRGDIDDGFARVASQGHLTAVLEDVPLYPRAEVAPA